MKSIVLLSSLLLLSGTAVAGDQTSSQSAANSLFSNMLSSATEVVSSTRYKRSDHRSHRNLSRQHQFDDDAYLRRISYND